MTKELLLETASAILPVSKATANEYEQKRNLLVSSINAHLEARLDLHQLVGEKNIEMMKDNHANHARFISSLLQHYNPTVLIETILWVFRAYQNHGFMEQYWAAQLNAWLRVMEQQLTETAYLEIAPLYTWMQVNIPAFTKQCPETPADNTPQH